MQVALPEFDGRLVGGPISFKEEDAPDPALCVTRRCRRRIPPASRPVADAALAWVRLARTPRPERRLALVLSDYPARGGRAGFAVGLDTPASACAILDLLAEAGYARGERFCRRDADAAPHRRRAGVFRPAAAYRDWLAALPEQRRADLLARWGARRTIPAA